MEEDDRKAMEKDKQELELAQLHPSLLEDKKYREEFDSINREFNNHHTFQGKFIQDKEDIELKGQLKAINVRQASENLLTFRKVPYQIWIAGFAIVVAAMWLIFFIALQKEPKTQAEIKYHAR